jgi:hypothetical protein
MNRYQPDTPRFAFALAALALTALTISLAVVAPARLDSLSADASVLAANRKAQAPTEVAIVPSRIDVIGIRSKDVAAAHVYIVHASAKPQS